MAVIIKIIVDFKKKQKINFTKTLGLITNLVGDIDTKMNKLRN